MAKIKAPLFSLDATGTLDKNITYKGLKQNHIAQKYSSPGAANPFESSPRQKDQRSIIRLITIHWQCMSSADKLSWENAAKDVRFKGTGYHYFLHMAQQNLTQYLGLVGYWSMNYNIDDNIPDLSGNGNDGTLSPIYPCDCPTLVDSFDKKHGKATKFDGVNDYINCGHDPSFDFTNAITIETFIRPTRWPNQWIWLICKNSDSAASTGWWLGNKEVEGVTFCLSNHYLRSYVLLSELKWSHLVGVFESGSTFKIYINGLLVASTVDFSFPIIPNILDVSIGRTMYYASPTFEGLLDYVRIYNRVLSEKEILKHYQSYYI